MTTYSKDDARTHISQLVTQFQQQEAAQHAQMVQRVDRMLAPHKQLAAAQTEDKRRLYQQQINATEKQIDTLVYQLYGLTDDEIKLVEGRA